MKSAVVVVLVLVYLALFLVTATGMFANSQYPAYRHTVRHCWDDRAFAIGLAILPPSFLVGPFITGFYQDGFTWRCHPDSY